MHHVRMVAGELMDANEVARWEAVVAHQATRINAALWDRQGIARVSQYTPSTLTPRCIIHPLELGRAEYIRKIEKMLDEVAYALGVSSVRLQQTDEGLLLEVPRHPPGDVFLTDLFAAQDEGGRVEPGTAMLGLTISTEECYLMLNIPSPDVAHVLITGATGCGKSVLAQGMILSLARNSKPREMQLGLLDPKGCEFDAFADLPHTMFYETDADKSVGWLRWLSDEMDKRYANRVITPRIIVFVDELADLLMVGGDAAVKALVRVVQKGRGAGIHVVGCVQYASARQMDAIAKAQFKVRVVGQVASAHDAQICAGAKETGAEKLQGSGDFLLVTGSRATHFQSGYVTPNELVDLTTPLCNRAPQRLDLPSECVPVPRAPLTGGRPAEPPKPVEVQTVIDRWLQDGNRPSKNWVRRTFRTRDSRAEAILDEASNVWRVRYETHTHFSQETVENE